MGLAFLWFKMAFRQVWNMRFDGVELPFQFNGMKKLLIILFALMPLAVLAEGRDDFAGALWIGAVADANDSLSDRSIILSKTFRNDLKKVRKAEAFVCGLGAYELYIDGRCISPDEVLSPAWSDYNKTVFYNVLDVTDCLNRVRQGGSHAGGKKAQLSKITDSIEHNVEVWLGNGFFHESGRRYHAHNQLRSADPSFLFAHRVCRRQCHGCYERRFVAVAAESCDLQQHLRR